MKNTVTISLFVFWTIVTALIVAGLVSYENKKLVGADTAPTPQGQVAAVGGAPGAQEGGGLTIASVQQHATPDNCWIIISNNIYDVTNYMNLHPGAASTIIPYCGADATNAFATKDKANPSPHSDFATSQLGSYYIGSIGTGGSAPVQVASEPSQAVVQHPSPPNFFIHHPAAGHPPGTGRLCRYLDGRVCRPGICGLDARCHHP